MRKSVLIAAIAVLVAGSGFAGTKLGDVTSPTDFKDDVRTHQDLDIKGTWAIDGTAVSATAAELNALDGIGATVAELNALDFSANETSGAESGTVSVAESYAPSRKEVLTVTDLSVVVNGTSSNGFGGTAFYTFPAGVIDIELSVVESVSCTSTGLLDGASGGDFSIGSAVIGTNETTSLTGTAASFIPSTSFDPLTNTVASAHLTAGAILDGHSTSVPVFFNVLIDDTDIAAIQTNSWSFIWTVVYKVKDY